LNLTDSSKDDVTAALVTPPVLMFARTGAPKPIEESCRLISIVNNLKVRNTLQHQKKREEEKKN
jgi:hypothetical protein